MIEFKKEEKDLNTLLAKKKLFWQWLAIIHDFCLTTNSLVDQLVDIMTYFYDVEEKITKFLSWQDSTEGILANIPRIEESHKCIVFREWEVCLNKT